jgi:hypothetical protein
MAKDLLSAIKIRKANKSDCMDLFEWRNDPLTRKNSINGSRKVSLEEHKKWFYSKLGKCSDTELFIAMLGKDKVGVMRFEIGEESILIGTNINPAFRGMGIGTRIMGMTMPGIYRKYKRPIMGELNNDNIASLKMCARNGFVVKEKKKRTTVIIFSGD